MTERAFTTALLGVNYLRIVDRKAAERRTNPGIFTMRKSAAVAYYRTSSATNVGADKDSERRQREAVACYARAAKLDVVAEFYDAAVSGADPVDRRPGFVRLLERCAGDGIGVVLVENASRFARDLAVQLTGHALLLGRGIELVPVDAPSHFTDPTPTAEMVRQILGAVSQFEKASVVAKLRHARECIRADNGRCEGRKPVPADVVAEARRLARRNPKTGAKRSLRQIAAELAKLGRVGPSGAPYFAGSVALMLARQD
jgi:DNA invertase Pin-like site-specific DNA recombinase